MYSTWEASQEPPEERAEEKGEPHELKDMMPVVCFPTSSY